jgi:2-oxoglutarate ferredoxin oxidoreductase subunit gamma
LTRHELRIAGFGGQGVVLAGHIVGQAISVHDNRFAAFTQSYGPEARGGSCTAEVVADEEPIGYPYIIKPDIVIALSQDAYNKYGRNLDHNTRLIIDPDLVKPDTQIDQDYLSVPTNRMARELGKAVVANIILLGFLAAVSEFVNADALRKSVLSSVPAGTEELNTKAFEAGYQYGIEQVNKESVSHG